MKFQVIFTFDAEYVGYVAEVPELPGCVSQGKTLDEAIENIKDAIKGYLVVLEKHGKPSENHSQEKSLYDKFDEIRLIGCCSVEANLSTTYKIALFS
ncbi:MAG: type II toxin-antitoxin system HicB family antitoxin [Gloeotrichia echinulata GP01]